MTNDVEHHSISLNKEDSNIPFQIYQTGLPRLLDTLNKYDVSSTFYFTGMFAEQCPESVELVHNSGHEVGCHGYDHSPLRAFDSISFDDQVNELKKAKSFLEPLAGNVSSFRAPALRLNDDTILALKKTGFKTDSSVASQRFDGPFTFGSKNKLKWLSAPRKPYTLSYESPTKSGNSGILEIPISAVLIPYIGTTMRICPSLLKFIEKYIFYEAYKTEKPVVFLFHPNECLDYGVKGISTRRSSNLIEYVFADVIRHNLKMRNLGLKSISLLDELLKKAQNYGFEFVTAKEFEQIYRR
ncbi:polysaccharide deacetylase family protein [Methanolobus vulcani]|nr:polysaccharide deacetylase family protein [Methanolobus vulcani]